MLTIKQLLAFRNVFFGFDQNFSVNLYQSTSKLHCSAFRLCSGSARNLYVVICTRNRVPGPGFKIHYPVPNPGNWYSLFPLITDETNKNLATCSFSGKTQYCRRDSTSAIFVDGVCIFSITDAL